MTLNPLQRSESMTRAQTHLCAAGIRANEPHSISDGVRVVNCEETPSKNLAWERKTAIYEGR